jgi:LmbE family N-acetylglucosaminyl deacetylase
MFNFKSVLVVAAHPDDEVLGCGGTIAKMIQFGVDVQILFLADGVYSRDNSKESDLEEELSHRKTSALNACKILGTQNVIFGDFQDNEMDKYSLLTITKKLETVINKFQPDAIFTHHVGDVNIDHQLTHKAVVTACRPQKNCSVKSIFTFEILSNTEWQLPSNNLVFAPSYFIDITSTLQLKINALKQYSFEMREWPHPRSIRAVQVLSNLRGSCIGTDAAEAFMVGRIIIK